jgi:hypothetical protein
VKAKNTAPVKTKMRTLHIARCAGRLPLLLLLIPLLNLSSSLGVEAARTPPDRIHVSSLKALTFYNGDLTRARRGRPIAQMQCRGKPCGKVCVQLTSLTFSASSANLCRIHSTNQMPSHARRSEADTVAPAPNGDVKLIYQQAYDWEEYKSAVKGGLHPKMNTSCEGAAG